MKRIKSLLVISPGYPIKEDPVYTFVEQLCVAMANTGLELTIVSPQSLPKHLFRRTPKHPFRRVYNMKNGGKLSIYQPYYISISGNEILSSKFFKKVVERTVNKLAIKPDACYAHFWNTGFSIYDFCKKNSLPLIVATGEGYLAGHKKTFEQEGFIDYAHGVAGVVCVSTKNKQDSISLGLTTEDKCMVIPNATDNKLFCLKDKIQLREEYKIDPNSFIVSFVGSFDGRKGPDRVAKAISLLDEESIKSFFIGKLHANNPHVPICDGILYKGAVEHSKLPDYLNMSDVFVLPTQNEGCCNAIVEAVACGLPIVSSDRPFNYDILDETNSLLIDPDNVNEIAESIKKLKKDEALRNKLAEGSRRKAEELSIEHRAERIIGFINESISYEN